MTYEDFLKTYEMWEGRMQHHGIGNLPFCVAFCGVFSSGKSSLLNALLDCGEVLPTGINPVTKVITRIRYGERLALHCVVAGRTVMIPEADMDDVIRGRKALPNGCTELIVELPAEILKNNVEFIDTPGYEDDAALEDMSRAAVLTADYIVFCCNATMLGQQFEKEYLQELKQTHGNFCMVVNRMDSLNTDEDCENVRITAGHLMSGCGTAAHPEQNRGAFFMTIAVGIYATLNGFDSHIKSLLCDLEERKIIRHSTNHCFTLYHKKQLLAKIREAQTSCEAELNRRLKEEERRREKVELAQKALRQKLEHHVEKAKLHINTLVRAKKTVLAKRISGLRSPYTFVADVKRMTGAELLGLIGTLAKYSEQNGLMPGQKVRSELNQFLNCIVPAPVYREEQRGLLERAVVSAKVTIAERRPYLDDGKVRVLNDYITPAITKVNNHLDNLVRKWNKLLVDFLSQSMKAAPVHTPDPAIAAFRTELENLRNLEKKVNAQEKLLVSMEIQDDPRELFNYICEQVEQFRKSIMQLPMSTHWCDKLRSMMDQWERELIKGALTGQSREELFDAEKIKAAADPIFGCMCRAFVILLQHTPQPPPPLTAAYRNLNRMSMLLYGEGMSRERCYKIANLN